MAKDKPNWRVTCRKDGKLHSTDVTVRDLKLHEIAGACRAFARDTGQQLVKFERIKS